MRAAVSTKETGREGRDQALYASLEPCCIYGGKLSVKIMIKACCTHLSSLNVPRCSYGGN